VKRRDFITLRGGRVVARGARANIQKRAAG
jgi:hypothetical protein